MNELGVPHKWSVIDYVREEVRRQGHDIEALDGIERVGWMLDAWCYALRQKTLAGPTPLSLDAVHIGMLIEPYKNSRGMRRVAVRVGTRICPYAEEVPRLLGALFERRDSMSPLELYKEFEEIHPFVDGNGRTGKILLNWIGGTLLEPVFPPNDLWGRPIVNP